MQHLSWQHRYSARWVDGTGREMVGVSMCVRMSVCVCVSSLPLAPRSPSTDGDLPQCTNKGLHC